MLPPMPLNLLSRSAKWISFVIPMGSRTSLTYLSNHSSPAMSSSAPVSTRIPNPELCAIAVGTGSSDGSTSQTPPAKLSQKCVERGLEPGLFGPFLQSRCHRDPHPGHGVLFIHSSMEMWSGLLTVPLPPWALFGLYPFEKGLLVDVARICGCPAFLGWLLLL